MKRLILLGLLLAFFLPSAVLADGKDKKKKKRPIKKTAAVKKVVKKSPRKPAPYINPKTMYDAANIPEDQIEGIIAKSNEFLKNAPVKEYEFPKTKDIVMLQVFCSGGNFMKVYTYNSLNPFLSTSIRLDEGDIKAMVNSGSYGLVSNSETDSELRKDHALASYIVRQLNPEKLFAETNSITVWKSAVTNSDFLAVVSALQNYYGSEFEVKYDNSNSCLSKPKVQSVVSVSGN